MIVVANTLCHHALRRNQLGLPDLMQGSFYGERREKAPTRVTHESDKPDSWSHNTQSVNRVNPLLPISLGLLIEKID